MMPGDRRDLVELVAGLRLSLGRAPEAEAEAEAEAECAKVEAGAAAEATDNDIPDAFLCPISTFRLTSVVRLF